MALGALLDAGADVDEVRGLLGALAISGWHLDLEATQRCGLGASRAIVTAPEGHTHRTHGAIRSLLAEATLPERLRHRALAVFAALAQAEAAIHRRPADDIELHEVGSLDAIVDIVGTCAALEVLAVDEVRAGTVAVGMGTVRAGHGILPNPAPATMALLAGAPVHGVDVGVELTTPTGAALLAVLATAFGPLPAMRPERIGYGAGSADIDGRPNVAQVVIGVATDTSPVGSAPGQPMTLLEVNVDDATGETLAHAVATLLARGANDAWVTPIVMKKGRPAHTVSVLCDPAVAPLLAAVMTEETGSLGLRGTVVERWPRRRDDMVVDVAGAAIAVKVGAGRVKVEHDHAVRAAAASGRSVEDVRRGAEAAARRQQAQQAQQ
jgi:uncharacterized protein (TIGR00299 family) protein